MSNETKISTVTELLKNLTDSNFRVEELPKEWNRRNKSIDPSSSSGRLCNCFSVLLLVFAGRNERIRHVLRSDCETRRCHSRVFSSRFKFNGCSHTCSWRWVRASGLD